LMFCLYWNVIKIVLVSKGMCYVRICPQWVFILWLLEWASSFSLHCRILLMWFAFFSWFFCRWNKLGSTWLSHGCYLAILLFFVREVERTSWWWMIWGMLVGRLIRWINFVNYCALSNGDIILGIKFRNIKDGHFRLTTVHF
jgi:hypothetical protein